MPDHFEKGVSITEYTEKLILSNSGGKESDRGIAGKYYNEHHHQFPGENSLGEGILQEGEILPAGHQAVEPAEENSSETEIENRVTTYASSETLRICVPKLEFGNEKQKTE